MHLLKTLITTGLWITISACQQSSSESPATTATPVALTAPVQSVSHEPNLTIGADGIVYLSWIEETADSDNHVFKFSRLVSGTWSDPETIASGNNWFVNWADVPSLVVGESTMTAHWLEKNGSSTYAYGVRFTQSADGGDTWSEPLWLHDDNSASEHGFVSFAFSGDNLAAAWLDGRKYAEGTNEMTLRTRFVNRDGTLGPEYVLDERVCDCCPVSAASTDDGKILVAYRNRTGDEIRDIATAYFDGSSWQEPVAVHTDNWMIAGCPVNGPALDIVGDQAGIAWFTAAQDTPQVNFAAGPVDGSSFSSPVQIDLGSPVGRVDVVALQDGGFLVVWLENNDESGTASILVRRVSGGSLTEADLTEPVTIGETSSGRGSGFPKIAATGDTVVFAWTQTSDTRTVMTQTMSLSSFE